MQGRYPHIQQKKNSQVTVHNAGNTGPVLNAQSVSPQSSFSVDVPADIQTGVTAQGGFTGSAETSDI